MSGGGARTGDEHGTWSGRSTHTRATSAKPSLAACPTTCSTSSPRSSPSTLPAEYFTTAPYACNPAGLPKYAPNKEMDAKFREDSRRRSNTQSHAGETARRPSRGHKSMQLQDTNQSHVHAEAQCHTTSPALCVSLLFRAYLMCAEIAACCGRRWRRGGE